MDFIILGLATWRISNLLVDEVGPFGVLALFRHRVGIRHDEHSQPYATNELAELFLCVYCLSVWLGIFCAVLYYFYPVATYWLCLPFALSAVACVVSKWMQ